MAKFRVYVPGITASPFDTDESPEHAGAWVTFGKYTVQKTAIAGFEDLTPDEKPERPKRDEHDDQPLIAPEPGYESRYQRGD